MSTGPCKDCDVFGGCPEYCWCTTPPVAPAEHVGETNFEGWLSAHERTPNHIGYSKQDLRDAFWAGYTERVAAPPQAEPLPDPLGCNACRHPDCARFDGPRAVECSAMADNACARHHAQAEPGALADELVKRLSFLRIVTDAETLKQIRVLAAALPSAQAEPPKPVAWQPIETAPRGPRVLVWSPDIGRCVASAGWRNETPDLVQWEVVNNIVCTPTHWMPLPPTPGAEPVPAASEPGNEALVKLLKEAMRFGVPLKNNTAYQKLLAALSPASEPKPR